MYNEVLSQANVEPLAAHLLLRLLGVRYVSLTR